MSTQHGTVRRWTLQNSKVRDPINHALFERLPQVTLNDVLALVHTRCGFMDAFDHVLGRYHHHVRDDRVVRACLIAWGTNLGLHRMGENSDMTTQTLVRASENYLRLETVRAANTQIINAIAALPLFRQYDMNGVVHSSSDGQKFEVDHSTTKARCYRDVCVDPQWHAQWQSRFGPFPLILWMVLHERRLQAVNRCWHAEWPEGEWLLATEAMIARNVWMYHEPHVEQLATVTMFVPGVATLGVMHHQQVAPVPAPPRLPAVPLAPPAPTPEPPVPPAPAPVPPQPLLTAPRAERTVPEVLLATAPLHSTTPIRRPRTVIRAADLPRSHTLTTSQERESDQLRTGAEPVRRTGTRQVIDWGKDLVWATLQAPASVRAWWQERAFEHIELLLSTLIIGLVVSFMWLWKPLRQEAIREYVDGVQLVASYLPEQRPPDPVPRAVPSLAPPGAPSCGRVQVRATGCVSG